MKEKLLLSYSGGRTSTIMTKWCLENLQEKYDMVVVFANTGKERPETLDFIKQCDESFNFNTVWLECVTNPIKGKGVSFKVVDYETANRDGRPFTDMVAKHGIPSVKSPHCTRELKSYTIKAYARSIGWKKYYTAIGIRMDEIDRMNEKYKEKRFIYPMIDGKMCPMTKNDVNIFWNQQSFDLNLKTYEGNCDLCFKKSFRKLMTIVKENPQLTEYWKELEGKYEMFVPNGKSSKLVPPLHMFRGGRNIYDIIEMSNNDFEMAVNEIDVKKVFKQLQLWGVDLDASNGCEESCEPFR